MDGATALSDGFEAADQEQRSDFVATDLKEAQRLTFSLQTLL